MFSQVHANRVLYKDDAKPGHRYRQITVVEREEFELHIFEGDVVQTEPAFTTKNPDAEVYFHRDLQSALSDVEDEFGDSVASGWIPYTP